MRRTEAQIIEQSENLGLQQMMTVRTKRGDEFVINADEAAKALAVLFSEMDNEKRFGWSLGTGWYEQELGITPQSLQKRMRRWPAEKIVAPLHQKRLFGSGLPQNGERGTNAKLNTRQAQEIFDRRCHGEIAKALAAEFGIGKQTVLDIASGKTWPDLNRSARSALAQSEE